MDEVFLKLTHSEPSVTNQKFLTTTTIPQIDGSDDVLYTPKKSVSKNRLPSAVKTLHKNPSHTPKKSKEGGAGSPLRSPRTPKSSSLSKYAPLPLVISNNSDKSLYKFHVSL